MNSWIVLLGLVCAASAASRMKRQDIVSDLVSLERSLDAVPDVDKCLFACFQCFQTVSSKKMLQCANRQCVDNKKAIEEQGLPSSLGGCWKQFVNRRLRNPYESPFD